MTIVLVMTIAMKKGISGTTTSSTEAAVVENFHLTIVRIEFIHKIRFLTFGLHLS